MLFDCYQRRGDRLSGAPTYYKLLPPCSRGWIKWIHLHLQLPAGGKCLRRSHKANIQSPNCFPLFRIDLLVSEDLGRNFSDLSFNPLHKQLFQNTEARVSLGSQHPSLTLPLQTLWSSLCFPTASNLLPPPALFHPLLKILGFFFFFFLDPFFIRSWLKWQRERQRKQATQRKTEEGREDTSCKELRGWELEERKSRKNKAYWLVDKTD